MKILDSYKLGKLELKNSLVMAPMTRCRAIGNIPNDLMAEYYGQRTDVGLIVTEGVAPSPNGLGYARIPGLFSQEQVGGWKKVTNAVHEKGTKIFAQLMHTGRVGHPLNLPSGGEILGPSPIAAPGQMWTDQEQLQDYPQPREMNQVDINNALEEYVNASKNAIEAGFDGIELHGANGYLIEQFINTATNKRTDNYGGSIENRCRFAIEVAQKVADAIGADKVAIRISPFGVYNGTEIDPTVNETFKYLATELGKIGIAYIHIVDHSAGGAPEVPVSTKEMIRDAFRGTIIISGGLTKDSANKVLEDGLGHLVAFGKAVLANPDLIYRWENAIELNQPNFNLLYTPGAEGYTDYPYAK